MKITELYAQLNETVREELENMKAVKHVLEGDRWAKGESAIALFDKSGITLVHASERKASLSEPSPESR